MLFRLPLLLAFLLSLALGPVQLPAACDVVESHVACGPCCAEPEMPCCASANQSAPVKTPDSVAPPAIDGKFFVSPAFVMVGLCPLPVMDRSSFHKRQAARMPVPPRLDLNCIRLI